MVATELATEAANERSAEVSLQTGIELRLVSRGYCHLCHQMEEALAPIAAEFSATVRVLDVDADAELLARYDELVPVLLHGETELCHYFLDVGKTREYLSGIR